MLEHRHPAQLGPRLTTLFPQSNCARWLGELAWEPNEGDVAHVSLERTLEITLSALSNSILLLLKHLKVNSIFQFEHLALTVAGFRGVPLILKFFNRKMETFLTALNEYV